MRSLAAAAGLLALAGAWLAPLHELLPGPFAAHMTMHMAVVAVAAPLLALAVAGTRVDPVRRWPGLFPPIPLSVVELVAVWAFHTPALHHVARTTTPGLVFEQATFLVSGLLVWLSALGGAAPHRATRAGSGVVALLLTSMHMTLLGALLALAPRPLFQHGEGDSGGMHGAPAATAHGSFHGAAPDAGALSPLADQELGGAIMLIVGGAVCLAGGLWLAALVLRRPAESAPVPVPRADA